MTSSLRRKPPITAQNTRRATVRSSGWALAWLWGGLVLALATPAWAGDAGPWRPVGMRPVAAPRLLPETAVDARPISHSQSRVGEAEHAYRAVSDQSEHDAVQQVSYTTGEAGNQLRWLPRRPTAGPILQTAAVGDEAGDEFVVPFGQIQQSMQPDDQAGPPAGLMRLEPANPVQTRRVQLEEEDLGIEDEPNPDEDAPSLADALRESRATDDDYRCPSSRDLKNINEISVDIDPREEGDFPRECPLGNDPYTPRCWSPMTFTWTASALCHKPLYFEDVQLERYGHSWGPFTQPFVSGARFFLTLPVLPYKMGLEPPSECIYVLGYYRPGNCAPYMLDPLPLSVRAALFEAGAWTGAAFIIP